jgi:hypothetical protein
MLCSQTVADMKDVMVLELKALDDVTGGAPWLGEAMRAAIQRVFPGARMLRRTGFTPDGFPATSFTARGEFGVREGESWVRREFEGVASVRTGKAMLTKHSVLGYDPLP